MFSRVKRSLVLRFEQLSARGPLAQLGVVAVLLLLIALVAGLLIHQLDPDFETHGEALWWAFEHVLVPEFIDGDDNFARRSVGTVLVILCSMLFIGTVVAILVQWMNSARERLSSCAESDARSIRGYVLVKELLEPTAARPSVLVELTDPENMTLFAGRRCEILVTPSIISHMMSRISLHRELRAVFDELFGSAGSEIRFRTLSDYGLAGEYAFSTLQQAARDQGEIAIGIRRAGGTGRPFGNVELNPGRDSVLQFGKADELIVITTPDSRDGSQG